MAHLHCRNAREKRAEHDAKGIFFFFEIAFPVESRAADEFAVVGFQVRRRLAEEFLDNRIRAQRCNIDVNRKLIVGRQQAERALGQAAMPG